MKYRFKQVWNISKTVYFSSQIINNQHHSQSFYTARISVSYTHLDVYKRQPMTTAEPERWFSTLKRAKSFLSSTMTQERLAALAMLSTENKWLKMLFIVMTKLSISFPVAKKGEWTSCLNKIVKETVIYFWRYLRM